MTVFGNVPSRKTCFSVPSLVLILIKAIFAMPSGSPMVNVPCVFSLGLLGLDPEGRPASSTWAGSNLTVGA